MDRKGADRESLPPRPTRSGDPVTFLLVDDRKENLIALEAALRRDGLRLLTARSGVDALELLLKHDVALAILDVQMADMNGFELAELMRGSERTRQVPIIFVTAGGPELDRTFDGYDAGAVDYLRKPLDPRVLRNKVDVFFRLCRQRMDLEIALRLNETFLAAVTHDLRNPLNSIVMAGQILDASLSSSERAGIVERLKSSSRRMTSLLDQLQDLAQSRLGGGLSMERKRVDPVALVRRVIDAFGSSVGRAISLEVTGEAQGEVDCDRVYFERAVWNVLSNAFKHGEADGPISVRLEMTPAELQPRSAQPRRHQSAHPGVAFRALRQRAKPSRSGPWPVPRRRDRARARRVRSRRIRRRARHHRSSRRALRPWLDTCRGGRHLFRPVRSLRTHVQHQPRARHPRR